MERPVLVVRNAVGLVNAEAAVSRRTAETMRIFVLSLPMPTIDE